MCGIFAIINKSESSNHNDTLKKLSKGLLKLNLEVLTRLESIMKRIKKFILVIQDYQ